MFFPKFATKNPAPCVLDFWLILAILCVYPQEQNGRCLTKVIQTCSILGSLNGGREFIAILSSLPLTARDRRRQGGNNLMVTLPVHFASIQLVRTGDLTMINSLFRITFAVAISMLGPIVGILGMCASFQEDAALGIALPEWVKLVGLAAAVTMGPLCGFVLMLSEGSNERG